MTRPQRLQKLAELFETLASYLSVCQDREKRKQILRKMKVIIDDIDDLTIKHELRLEPDRDSTAPQSDSTGHPEPR